SWVEQFHHDKVERDHESYKEEHTSPQPEEMHWTLGELAHECDRHEVEESVHESSHTKLRDAILALAMFNRFLGDALETRPLREHGNVAMHFTVDFHTLHYFATVGLEPAVEVVQFYSGNPSCYS